MGILERVPGDLAHDIIILILEIPERFSTLNPKPSTFVWPTPPTTDASVKVLLSVITATSSCGEGPRALFGV